jgi:cellulose synthase operon protein C
MSEVEAYDSLVLRLRAGKKTIWMTVHDKFSPFGTISSELRGQDAIVLIAGAPHDKTDLGGALDGVVFSGRANLRADGSADLDLVQSYTGKLASSMRDVLAKVPEAQLDDFVETRLVGRNFPGARVHSLKVENRESLDEPLVLRVSADVRDMARPGSDGLVLKSLFPMRLSQLAVLPERQTPLLIGVSSHIDVRFEIVVPASMKMPTSLPSADIHDADRVVSVKDKVNGHTIDLARTIDIPAGRIQPGAAYAKFVQFTQNADDVAERDIRIGK